MSNKRQIIDKFAFSTSWNTLKERDGAKIVRQIRDLGFVNVELNFQFDREKLKGVFECLQAGEIRITGVHNFCPTPEGVEISKALPDCFSLAAVDENERKRAVECTRASIATTKELGGTYVVIHSGRVEMQSRMRQIINLAKEGKRDSSEFETIKHGMLEERRDKIKEHFDALTTSYSELTKDAMAQDIILGLENRFYVRELPAPDEIETLLKYFRKENLRYWHDVGHAVIQETLGFYGYGEYIERFHRDMFGVHLHDVRHYRDHNMPCLGEVDFIALESFIKDDVVKVIEVHGHQTKDDIRASLEQLNTIF
ncbi:MAG: TIM barrel protein [Candidatus Omnitrophica bacterium]|nr:TIM barrel protein [Candidatus Omnitrophota bacterium]